MASFSRPVSSARAWLALAVIGLLLIVVVSGIVFTVASSLATGQSHPRGDPRAAGRSSPAASTATSSVNVQDELAARPMPQLPASASRPQPLAAGSAPPPLATPSATQQSGLVPTGFPRTPEGALAQLAAVDSVALRDLTPNQLAAVHTWAALPGAVALTDWTPYVAATAALEAAGLPQGSADLTSTFTPVEGLIKGTAGTDFAVVCVLGEWQVTYRATSRAGAADCQRMVWSQGRWHIGPGAQPAYGPSAWPGSADAVRAGWRGLADA